MPFIWKVEFKGCALLCCAHAQWESAILKKAGPVHCRRVRLNPFNPEELGGPEGLIFFVHQVNLVVMMLAGHSEMKNVKQNT